MEIETAIMTTPTTPTTQHPCVPAAILSYLVPGLGQIYQGRIAKGVMFMVCLLGMFVGGQALGDWRNVYIPGDDPNGFRKRSPNIVMNVIDRWHFAGQFWIGVAAWPAIWQFYNLPVPAADGHPFWNTFQRGPRTRQDEDNLNTYLTNSDKLPELAWVYTVVAGMLNILVIYDAFSGPAHGDENSPEGPAT
jgi:hypothetical protein